MHKREGAAKEKEQKETPASLAVSCFSRAFGQQSNALFSTDALLRKSKRKRKLYIF